MTWAATWRVGAALSIGLYRAVIRALDLSAAAAVVMAGFLMVREMVR